MDCSKDWFYSDFCISKNNKESNEIIEYNLDDLNEEEQTLFVEKIYKSVINDPRYRLKLLLDQ